MPRYYSRWDLSIRAEDAVRETRAAQEQFEDGHYDTADDYARRAIAHLVALRRGGRKLAARSG